MTKTKAPPSPRPAWLDRVLDEPRIRLADQMRAEQPARKQRRQR